MKFLLFLFLGSVYSHSHGHESHSCSNHNHETPPPSPSPANPFHQTAISQIYDLFIHFIHNWAPRFGVSEQFFGTIASVLVVGIAPIAILPIFPISQKSGDKKILNHNLLNILLAFAAGGLLGDVFLHLIPHAIQPHTHTVESEHHHHSHGHHHSDDHLHDHTEQTLLGLYILGGMFIFFIVEKLVVAFQDSGHGHSHGSVKAKDSQLPPKQRETVGAFLNIIADFTHNFTDGMAIAASFQLSHALGVTTAFAVLVHEIPHEIGDMAILLKSGVQFKHVLGIQVGTAVGAIFGALFGLHATTGKSEITTSVILPITAGGFIYIATVGIIPKLFESTSLRQSVFESIAMVCGVSIMLFIALVLE